MPAGATRRWQLASEQGAPACGGLFLFPLDVTPIEQAALRIVLSHAERQRASRFHFEEHARRFEIAHARLRALLADLLQVAPQGIEFSTGEHGKPALAGEAAASGIHFNLSHSGGWGLIGWALQREIGVDVECWRTMRDEAALVRRFFSPAEIAAYESLPEESRSLGFFNCWTRKEAYIKAVGRGLGLPLDSFDVTLDSGPRAQLLRASTHNEDGRCWSLAAPEAPIEASLAVVLQGPSVIVRTD